MVDGFDLGILFDTEIVDEIGGGARCRVYYDEIDVPTSQPSGMFT